MKKYLLMIFCIAFVGVAEAKKCSDFSTQVQAQKFYDSAKKKGITGWRGLDRDKDGRACDCLPGGSGRNCPKK